MSKSQSPQRLVIGQAPDWLFQTAQQIQVIDYELHAAIRIITRGEMQPEQIPAFMEACTQRDRLMARVISHLAGVRKQATYKGMESTDDKA